MGKLFGTDGIRGVVGENLTADMAFRVGQSIASVLEEEKGGRPTVVIGKDTRISSDMLESALMAGICDLGGDVKPLGTIPTPAVAYLARQERADAGIVISASHNPYEHNGIKVFSGQGYKLSDSVEARIEEKILSAEPPRHRTRGEIGRRHHGMRQLKRDYIDFAASTVESDLSGLKILVDCANGAASATATGALRPLQGPDGLHPLRSGRRQYQQPLRLDPSGRPGGLCGEGRLRHRCGL